MTPVLRPIQSADADAFASLVRRVFAGLDLVPPPSAGRLTGDDIRNHLAQGGGGVTTDPISAGLLWSEKNGGLYVSRVAVDPALQRRGLATLLLGTAEAEALRRGLPLLWLSTRLSLISNRRLFARFGFTESTRHAHPGFAQPTFVDMVKPIDHELIREAGV